LNENLVEPLFAGSQDDCFCIVQILLGDQLIKNVNSLAIHVRTPLLDEPSGGTVRISQPGIPKQLKGRYAGF
jgi:hypothetical protein